MSRFNKYLEAAQHQPIKITHLKDDGHEGGQEGWEILINGQVEFYIWKKRDGGYDITDEAGSELNKTQKEKLLNHPSIKKLGL